MKFSQSFYDRGYSVLRVIYRFLFKIVFRWEASGIEYVPRTGGAILAVNHSSVVDAPLGGVALERKIWFLGRSSLIKNKFLAFIMNCQHMIPINRGTADVRAIRRIIELLESGEIVLMFPEGTRGVGGRLGPGKGGVGLFVAHARADVIPCYIANSWRAMPRGAIVPRPRKIRILYGPVIRYEEFKDVPVNRDGFRRISEAIMSRIAGLKAQVEGRGATHAAGQPVS
ncbi:MAG: lysophospholipid acyltransferase family protein [Candidatus Aureabacteria bacterium]|nr:lysophospholipid acyltransferase family protein [Candidatus Auribacterota bacterium]